MRLPLIVRQLLAAYAGITRPRLTGGGAMIDQPPQGVTPQRTTALIWGDLRNASWRAGRVMVTDPDHAVIHAEINDLLDELARCLMDEAR